MYGERLKELRHRKGYSQQELGTMIDVKRVNISHYENGRIVPPVEVMRKLADVFHVSVDYLLGRVEREESFVGTYTSLSDEEKDRLQIFFREVESLIREKGDLTEGDLSAVLHYMRFVFRQDLTGGEGQNVRYRA